jgi:hypothetical protein
LELQFFATCQGFLSLESLQQFSFSPGSELARDLSKQKLHPSIVCPAFAHGCHHLVEQYQHHEPCLEMLETMASNSWGHTLHWNLHVDEELSATCQGFFLLDELQHISFSVFSELARDRSKQKLHISLVGPAFGHGRHVELLQ